MKIGRGVCIVTITVFFAVTWGILLRDNLSFGSMNPVTPDYGRLLDVGETSRTTHMGIYYGDTHVGDSISTIRRRYDSIRMQNVTEVTLPAALAFLVPGTDKLKIDLSGEVSEEGRLEAITIECDQLNIHLQGGRHKEQLRLRGMVGGQSVDRDIEVDARSFIGQTLSPLSGLPPLDNLEEGRRWIMKVFNPVYGSFQDVEVQYVEHLTTHVGGARLSFYKLELAAAGRTWVSYLNEADEIVLQGSPYGLKLVRENLSREVRRFLLEQKLAD